MLIDHQDQQIVLQKTQSLELCIGTNVGTNQAKIEKISISRAIWLEFLRSLVRAIRCEANKINLLHEERPIGLRSVKMLRDLLWRARGPARHVAVANARAKVRARLQALVSNNFSPIPSKFFISHEIKKSACHCLKFTKH